MPRYEYRCSACGPFARHVSISRYLELANCPSCGTASPRAVSSPFITRLAPGLVKAHLRNEKAADEPMVMHRNQFERTGLRLHELHAGNQADHHGGETDIHRQTARQLEAGLKTQHMPPRPWSLGH